jgi:hypothetical protein
MLKDKRSNKYLIHEILHFWKIAIPFGGQLVVALSSIFFNTTAVASPGFTTIANGFC